VNGEGGFLGGGRGPHPFCRASCASRTQTPVSARVCFRVCGGGRPRGVALTKNRRAFAFFASSRAPFHRLSKKSWCKFAASSPKPLTRRRRFATAGVWGGAPHPFCRASCASRTQTPVSARVCFRVCGGGRPRGGAPTEKPARLRVLRVFACAIPSPLEKILVQICKFFTKTLDTKTTFCHSWCVGGRNPGGGMVISIPRVVALLHRATR